MCTRVTRPCVFHTPSPGALGQHQGTMVTGMPHTTPQRLLRAAPYTECPVPCLLHLCRRCRAQPSAAGLRGCGRSPMQSALVGGARRSCESHPKSVAFWSSLSTCHVVVNVTSAGPRPPPPHLRSHPRKGHCDRIGAGTLLIHFPWRHVLGRPRPLVATGLDWTVLDCGVLYQGGVMQVRNFA